MVEDEREERVRRPAKPRVGLAGQWVPLFIGAVPILLVMAFLTRGKAGGLHGITLGLWIVAILGGLASLAYHLWYRDRIPKVVIFAPSIWKTIPIAALILILGLINLWGAPGNWALQLTHNQMESPGNWLRLLAKLLIREPAVAENTNLPSFAAWVSGPGMLNGALWAAIGYAMAFGIGGFFAAAARREAFDPRQEPFGTAGAWPILRALIGYFYGWALGFALGTGIVGTLSFFIPNGTELPPAIAAFKIALGAVSDPNQAFSAGFVAGAFILAFGAVFMGKGDFTVSFTDPRPPEKEPPMKVTIPSLPKLAAPQLDFSALAGETEQIAAAFGRDLQALAQQLGFSEAPGLATFAADSRKEDEGPAEVPAVNLLSARRPEFDTAFDEALGQLASVYVQISAQLGQIQVPLAEWLTLEEGSLLEMPRSQDGTISLLINGQPVGRARPAVHENHVAVKVTRLDPGTVDALKGG